MKQGPRSARVMMALSSLLLVLLLVCKATAISAASQNELGGTGGASSSGGSSLGFAASIYANLHGLPQDPVFLYSSQNGFKIGVCYDSHCNARGDRIEECGVTILSSSIVGMDVGYYPRLFYARVNADLTASLLTRACLDASCTASTPVQIGKGDIGYALSATGGNGSHPILVYIDQTTSTVKMSICSDFNCVSTSDIVLDPLGPLSDIGTTSVAVNSQHIATASYHISSSNANGSHSYLSVGQCQDMACSSIEKTSIDGVEEFSSLAIRETKSSSDTLIAFVDKTNTLILLTCLQQNCTADTSTQSNLYAASNKNNLVYPQMILINNNPLIIVIDQNRLLAVHCIFDDRDKMCRHVTVQELARALVDQPWLISAMQISVTKTAANRAFVIFNEAYDTFSSLNGIDCLNAECTEFNPKVMDGMYGTIRESVQPAFKLGVFLYAFIPVMMLCACAGLLGYRYQTRSQLNVDVKSPFLSTVVVSGKFKNYLNSLLLLNIAGWIVATMPWLVYFSAKFNQFWYSMSFSFPPVLGTLAVIWGLNKRSRRILAALPPFLCLIQAGLCLLSSMIAGYWDNKCLVAGLQATTLIFGLGVASLSFFQMFVLFFCMRLYRILSLIKPETRYKGRSGYSSTTVAPMSSEWSNHFTAYDDSWQYDAAGIGTH